MRALPHLAALAIVVASGVLHVLWSGRGSRPDELAARAARLDRVPVSVGGWEGRPMPLDRRMVEVAEIAGYLLRRYEDRRGDAVTALLVCGRPGPVSVHTPEVCYGGMGYELSAPMASVPVEADRPARPDEFWAADLVKEGAVASQRLRILYAWTVDGDWRASRNPRLDFAGSPALYKLYLIREVTGADEPARDDAVARFARQFLPELRKVLFPAP